MSVQEIEEAIAALSPQELVQLGDWFAQFEARAWDRKIEKDSLAGSLDALISEAQATLRSSLLISTLIFR